MLQRGIRLYFSAVQAVLCKPTRMIKSSFVNDVYDKRLNFQYATFLFLIDVRRYLNIGATCLYIHFGRHFFYTHFETNLKEATHRIRFHCMAISMTMSMTAISASEPLWRVYVHIKGCPRRETRACAHTHARGKHYFEREGTKMYIRVYTYFGNRYTFLGRHTRIAR